MNKKLLLIAPNNYEDIEKKGVMHHYSFFKEDGFFKKIIVLFPIARNDFEHFDDDISFFQYGWKSKYKVFNRFSLFKILGSITILWKLFFIFPFIIKKEKVSLIRATDPYYMGLIGLFYAKLFNIPLTISVHSDYDMGDKLGGQTFKVFGSRKIAKKLEKFIYKYCDKILPISHYLKQNIIKEYDIEMKKIEIFPHGISFDDFDNTPKINLKEKFSIGDNTYLIGYVARLSKEKHCLDILEIVKKLIIIRKDFIVLVAGNGKELQHMNEFIVKNNLEEYIKLLGFQDKNMVCSLRKESEINLCLLDGFSLIEACASKKAVIAYDTEWHYSLVIDNETGYLVKENSINCIVNKICYLLDNREVSKRLGDNARKLAFKNHDIDNTVKIKQSIYQRVLDGS